MSGDIAGNLWVGVISDTHGLMRPEAVQALAGVDHILHAGDVGNVTVLEALRAIAPVTAIRGNVDVSGVCAELPATTAVELGGVLFYLVHAIEDLDIVPMAASVSAVIYGHSHKPSVKVREGVLYLNPGSAGPKRFDLPVSMAKVLIENGEMRAELINLQGGAGRL